MDIQKIKQIQKASVWGRHDKFQSWLDEIESTYPCIKDMSAEQIAVVIDYGYTRQRIGEEMTLEWFRNSNL